VGAGVRVTDGALMDTRLSAEQVALRDSVASAVDKLGPKAVADLDDRGRVARLESAVAASGWHELRTPNDDGTPLASAVEAAIVAEELAHGLADVAFVGPTLAAELRRLAGAEPRTAETIVLTGDLSELAGTAAGRPSLAVDAKGATAALLLAADGFGLATVALGVDEPSLDLTRRVASVPEGSAGPVPGEFDALTGADLARWSALGLSLCCADLVGVMRGAISLATGYARERRQYGAAIGSFQAVQHLLADAHVSMEGSRSVALHAAWAVDALGPDAALGAAAVAKAYCARAARAVCETTIQVHGGIGNTWDCLAHVYLRRALHSSEILGGVGPSLARVAARHELGGGRGLL